MERLQKIIQKAGIASRRKAEEMISAGRVTVNGVKVTELGSKAGPKDDILVDGKKVKRVDLAYFLLYKPEGYLSTTHDNFNRLTVMDLMPQEVSVFPVGRLDYNTSGLIIMTNDGEISHALTHPKFKLEKEYYVKVTGLLRKEETRDICNGIDLGDFFTQKAKITKVSYDDKKEHSFCNITITEGKYHQVKRMFEKFDHKVVKLKRVRYGVLDLKGLNKGEYRKLKIHEIKKLWNLSENGN
ncbi:MAG: rRNA pseudouridine synthase [Tenericutes bacterium]|nr:rRNA pseudouridine synthase [Mycoplasmatota bacterium]